MADKKKGAEPKKKKAYSIANCYSVEGGKLVRKNQWSPKAGTGYFMAEHKDRRTCGSTSYMEKK